MTGLAAFESSIAEHYHEATKYSEEGLRRESSRHGPPDMTRRPSLVKTFDGPRVLLPTAGLPLQRRGPAAPVVAAAPAGSMDLAKLARVLWHTNGCTLLEQHPWGFQHFRAAPSAGAMYPTEVYVAVRGMPGLAPGVYDYQVLDHSLALVREGDVLPQLHGAAFGNPAVAAAEAVVLLTAEWFRSSWRYRERGYRRALLDTGHVLGNVVAAAPCEGFTAMPVASFRDEVIEKILGIEPATEGALAMAPLVASSVAQGLPAIPQRKSDSTEWKLAMAAVGGRVDEGAPERIIAALHLAGRLGQSAESVMPPPARPTSDPDSPFVGAGAAPTSWSADEPVTSTIAGRRSTRAFSGVPVRLDALLRALAHAYPSPERSLFAPEILRTYVVAMNVQGLEPGSYAYEISPRRLSERCPGELSAALHHLGLAQDIFTDAAAALIHTVDLTRAVERYGDRVYRLVSLDAGHVGERFNLALLREGLGVSGCGGYYDDEMNRVLKIPESQAVVYITAAGVPAS